ncbi:MAG TPA: DUF692 family protein [Pyrinomonadaceae bacterium]|jgi:uncharacterized protein (UPF0276 family)
MSNTPLVPKLGIGLAYQSALRPFIEEERERFDFLEVVPDILWSNLGRGHSPQYVDDAEGADFMRRMRAEMFIVPHSIGLSIGSSYSFERNHLTQIKSWHEWLKFPWHSDHLSYNLAEHADGEMNVGVTLPMPHDAETLDLLAPRIHEVRASLPVPFLLENNVYYFNFADEEMTEARFLNRLCELSGCYLLLDLHNLYTNCRNHEGDAYEFLSELNLDRVLEIHVAGGMEYGGVYLDAHSDTSPQAVWELLDYVLPQCANLGGVVFELVGSWYQEVGRERLSVQLARMKELWLRHQPAPLREAVA